MREACGIFGIYAPKKDVSQITYFALHALQHRGQESSGMAVSDGKNIQVHKKMGLVSQVYDEQILNSLKGDIAIGHNRYGTCGSSCIENAQPILLETNLGSLAIAHNGNLTNTIELKKNLFSIKESFTTSSDSELIAKMIAKASGRSWNEKIVNGLSGLQGAYSLVILTKNRLYAVRDPWGIRPLVLGKFNGGFVFASESSCLSNIGAKLIRDVKPGEIISADLKGFRTIKTIKKEKTAFCIFEYIYFSRPDTVLNGQLVYQARMNAGKILAHQHPAKADYVISIPDSGTSAAIGFSQASGIPFIEGLLKSRYIGRTFIQPETKIRKLGVRLKFNPVGGLLKGKSVVVVDDSIVRGTTITGLIKMLKDVGVSKIHLRIASPPLISPCYLGVDIERYSELIAHGRSIQQIGKKIGADSLGYLSLDGLKKAIGSVNCGFCTGCFTREYPVPIELTKKPAIKENSQKIAVFISDKGTGSNLQALIDAVKQGKINGEIVSVVSDKKKAYGLTRAKKENIPSEIFELKDSKNPKIRKKYFKRMLRIIREKYNPDLLVLAGWMLILPKEFLKEFPGTIINLHPGLIPDKKGGTVILSNGKKADSFSGKMTEGAVESAFKSGQGISGSTVHFVTETVDWGPVILRTEEKIKKDDTVDEYYQRLKLKEHKILSLAVSLFCQGKLKIVNNIVLSGGGTNELGRKLNLLVVGGGGREHALAWKLAQSPLAGKIFVAPGNAGTAGFCKNISIRPEELGKLRQFAIQEKIDLTVVGPDNPLALGIVDYFKKKNLSIFGPEKKAAEIEFSKVFAKKFMKRFGISTAKFRAFSDFKSATKYLTKSKFPIVLKADGLAAGKGVILCDDLKEAKQALKIIMVNKKFGESGKKVVVEEYLTGQEVSVFCLSDGTNLIPLLPAQDHKQINDGDQGPNTGGMGTYAPTSIVDRKTLNLIVKTILKPTIRGLKKIDREYRGVLYAGLMLTSQGPKVLEFNARFGDPETQPQMLLLKDDLLPLMLDCAQGTLKRKNIAWHPGYSVCVILASKGYPGSYQTGFEIKNLPAKDLQNLQVFHAGTTFENKRIVTSGGRIMGITSKDAKLKLAIAKAYLWAKKIKFKNKYYRHDIGYKGLHLQI